MLRTSGHVVQSLWTGSEYCQIEETGPFLQNSAKIKPATHCDLRVDLEENFRFDRTGYRARSPHSTFIRTLSGYVAATACTHHPHPAWPACLRARAFMHAFFMAGLHRQSTSDGGHAELAHARAVASHSAARTAANCGDMHTQQRPLKDVTFSAGLDCLWL